MKTKFIAVLISGAIALLTFSTNLIAADKGYDLPFMDPMAPVSAKTVSSELKGGERYDLPFIDPMMQLKKQTVYTGEQQDKGYDLPFADPMLSSNK